MGVGAHITAAGPKGPRRDDKLSREQRASAANGIWLCEYCGTLVDKDASSYEVKDLHELKTRREAEAAKALLPKGAKPKTKGPHLKFAPFFHDNTDKRINVKGTVLGLDSNTIVLTGRETIGVIENDGTESIAGLSVKAMLPSGRAVPLSTNQTEIHAGDSAEFTLCMTGLGKSVDEAFAMFSDQIVYPMPEELEVTIRVTSKNGGEPLTQKVRLARPDVTKADAAATTASAPIKPWTPKQAETVGKLFEGLAVTKKLVLEALSSLGDPPRVKAAIKYADDLSALHDQSKIHLPPEVKDQEFLDVFNSFYRSVLDANVDHLKGTHEGSNEGFERFNREGRPRFEALAKKWQKLLDERR
jgi:hypothetical protein